MIYKYYHLYKQLLDERIKNNTFVVLLIVLILFGTVITISHAEGSTGGIPLNSAQVHNCYSL